MRKIVASPTHSPLPVRQIDWCAHYDGEEEAGNYGYGATEAEAIEDFMVNCAADHDERLGAVGRGQPTDWSQSPPFITSISGNGTYEVNIKVHSLKELHAAHDLVLKAFSDARSSLIAKRWADANQG